MKRQHNIQSRWTNSLKRGQNPNDKDLRDHLQLVHRDHPGFAESCALHSYDSSGRNSYETLADVFDPKIHSTLLDLACGSGVLLEICRKRSGQKCDLTGVDMSSEELDLARRRNNESSIKLFKGIAQDLHFIADSTFDVVLCHWALTLMDQVPLVLKEVGRILKPNGVFAAIVDGDPLTADGYADVNNIIYDAVKSEFNEHEGIQLGDPRVRSAQTLIALINECMDGVFVDIEPMVFVLDGTPESLAKEVSGFFYASFLITSLTHTRMLKELEHLFASQSQGNRCSFSMPVNKLVIRQKI